MIQFVAGYIGGLSAYMLYLTVGSVFSFYLLIVIFSLLGRGCGPHLREAEQVETAG